MNTAEVVVREMQRYSRFQVQQLLAESIRQVRESAHLQGRRFRILESMSARDFFPATKEQPHDRIAVNFSDSLN